MRGKTTDEKDARGGPRDGSGCSGGQADATIYYAQAPSALGTMLLRVQGACLTGLFFTDQKDCPPLDGLPPPRPDSLDPASGLREGKPIRKLRARKADPFSGDLFADLAPAKARQLRGVLADGADAAPPRLMQADTPDEAAAVLNESCRQLREYLAGRRHAFDVPLSLRGTDFQRRVWQALLQIPYGEAVSYGDVARAVGLSAAHGRPVGGAVGRNPIAVIVPCHRVLSGTQALTGYTGGLERKYALLELEGFALGGA